MFASPRTGQARRRADRAVPDGAARVHRHRLPGDGQPRVHRRRPRRTAGAGTANGITDQLHDVHDQDARAARADASPTTRSTSTARPTPGRPSSSSSLPTRGARPRPPGSTAARRSRRPTPSSSGTRARPPPPRPGVTPSTRQIIAAHPLTLLIAGHTHTYAYYASEKQIIVGNGGAPLAGSVNYGYVVAASRRTGTCSSRSSTTPPTPRAELHGRAVTGRTVVVALLLLGAAGCKPSADKPGPIMRRAQALPVATAAATTTPTVLRVARATGPIKPDGELNEPGSTRWPRARGPSSTPREPRRGPTPTRDFSGTPTTSTWGSTPPTTTSAPR